MKRPLVTLLRWGGRALLVGLGLFLGLIVYLLIRESVTRARYRAEFPPPGQMVDLGGHQIHLNCVGSGTPTVVFEADLDQYGSLSWTPVQAEIGKVTRACSYDRAGIMWSEPGPRPRDGETIAGELGAALDAAGERGPYVLVGHAFGGAYVRIFAGRIQTMCAAWCWLSQAIRRCSRDTRRSALLRRFRTETPGLRFCSCPIWGCPGATKGTYTTCLLISMIRYKPSYLNRVWPGSMKR